MSIRRSVRACYLVIWACMLAAMIGCADRYATSSAVEKLDKRMEETQNSLKAVTTCINEANDKIITTQEGRIKKLERDKEEASGFIYGAMLVNNAAPAINLGVQSELSQAQNWTGQANEQTLLQAKQRADLLLKNTQESLAQLKVLYAEKAREAEHLKEVDVLNQKVIVSITAQKDKSEGEQKGLQNSLEQTAISRNQAIVEAKAKQEIIDERNKLNHDLKRLLLIFLAIAGIACIILGALAFRFYMPMSIPLGIAGAAFLSAAVVIMYIQAWMVMCLLGVGVASVGLALWIRYQRTRQIADYSTGAIQQLRNDAQDGDATAQTAYDRLKPELVDWFGEKGHRLHDEIKQRLVRLNVIGNNNK
jgi:hypothetical protein